MTQHSHTPGPWHIFKGGFSTWVEIEPGKLTLVKASEPNLRLIAATPELYDIAVAARKHLCDENPGGDDLSTILKQLDAAIAKATGVAP